MARAMPPSTLLMPATYSSSSGGCPEGLFDGFPMPPLVGWMVVFVVAISGGTVPRLQQHTQTGPGVEPCRCPQGYLLGRYGAYLLETCRYRLLDEPVDIGGKGSGVVEGLAQGCPLGHQPSGAAIGGSGMANLYDRTANGVLQDVDGVIGGPCWAVRIGAFHASLRGPILS